jgi:hypothetical protein
MRSIISINLALHLKMLLESWQNSYHINQLGKGLIAKMSDFFVHPYLFLT